MSRDMSIPLVTPPDLMQLGMRRGGQRPAFTLIELLVVIAIIALLFSFLAVGVMSAIGSAKAGATKATITKVQGLLQQRIDSVIKRNPNPTLVQSLQARFPNEKRAIAFARKYEFRKAFPQSWAEMATYNPTVLVNQTIPTAAQRNPKTESAEVLFFLLTKANVLGYPPEGLDVFLSTEYGDTDNPPNGAPELLDAWGQPLRFYRWPTRLVRGAAWTATPQGAIPFTPSATARLLMPALPTSAIDLTHDSDDKYGLMYSQANWSQEFAGASQTLPAAHAAYFENGLAPAPTAMNRSPFYQLGAFHTLETFSLPLIVSAGPDLETGLYEPTDPVPSHFGNLAAPDPAAVNATYDDISNLNIRSGGK